MVSKQNNGNAVGSSSGVGNNHQPSAASPANSQPSQKKNQSSGQQSTPTNNNNNTAWSNKTKPSNHMDSSNNNQKRNNNANNNKGSTPNNQQPTQHQNKNGSNATTNPPRVKNTHSNITHSENNEQYKHKSEINRKRMFFLFLNFVGHVVEIVNVSGEVYEGIFHTAKYDSTSDDFVFVLTLSKLLGGSGTQTIHETMTFKSKDVQQIYAKNITFNSKKTFTSFKTDTEISNRQQTEKELIKWQPEENEGSELTSLEESTYAPRQWDQFSENLNKFGVKSTYEEHLYTTNLDKNSDFYRIHAAKASKIAGEIEKSAPSLNSIHMLEERGLLEQTDISEEDLYSSVIRDQKSASAFKKQPKKNIPKNQPLTTSSTQAATSGKYVPPHKQSKTPHVSQPLVKHTQEAEAILDREPVKIKTLSPIIEGIKGSIGKSRSVSQVVLPEKSLIEKSLPRNSTTQMETPKPKNIANLLVDTNRPGRSSSFTIGSAPLPQKIEEHKNIRAQLTSTKPVASPKLGSGTLSPTLPPSPIGLGFPKASSPSTPIKESIISLHLQPFVPKLKPEVVEDYIEFKKKNSNDLHRNRERETSLFKEFSSLLSSKIKNLPEPTTSTATKPSTEIKTSTETKKEQPKEEEKPKPKSTLNPNAKAFVFNPKTPAFVPKVSTGSTPTSTPPTTSSNPQMPPPQVTQPQMVPPVFYPTPPMVGYPPGVGTPFVYTPQFPPTNQSYNNFRTISWNGNTEDIQIRNHFFKVSLDQFEKSVGPAWLDDEEIEQRKSFKDEDATSITSVDIDSQAGIHQPTNPPPYPYYYPQPGMMVPPPYVTPVVTAYSGFFPPVNPIPRDQ